VYPNSDFAHPIGSFQTPVPIPSLLPDQDPLVTVCINQEWVYYVIGALKQLLLQSTWDYPDIASLDAQQQHVFDLIGQFADPGNCLPFPTLPNWFPHGTANININSVEYRGWIEARAFPGVPGACAFSSGSFRNQLLIEGKDFDTGDSVGGHFLDVFINSFSGGGAGTIITVDCLDSHNTVDVTLPFGLTDLYPAHDANLKQFEFIGSLDLAYVYTVYIDGNWLCGPA